MNDRSGRWASDRQALVRATKTSSRIRMTPFTLPSGYPRIKVVRSFDELIATPFGDGINALCWERTLSGDFGEVVERLGVGEEMATLDEARLNMLSLSAAG